MLRNASLFVFDRFSGLVRASVLAVPLAVTVTACDDPALEAELAAEDAALAAEDAAEDAALAADHAELAPGIAGAVDLVAADDPQLGLPQPLCCSIDWQILFSPRVRLSTMSSEGCSVYWPPTLTARSSYTVYFEYGVSPPSERLAGWLLPNTVAFLPLNHTNALSASHCVAQAIP